MDTAIEALEEQSGMSTDATVLIVDDDPAVLRGISRLVRAAGFKARTHSSPQRFLRQQLPDGPACVILDMCMDGVSGLEVQDVLRTGARQIPIIFVSGHGTIPAATLAIKNGAVEFLEKPFRPKALLEAIRGALDRDRTLSADRSDQEELTRRYNTLTPREREVMALVVAGLLNKQSAAELAISEKTIKVHRSRVMEKMRVESVAELVRIAVRINVAPAPTPQRRFSPDRLFDPSPAFSRTAHASAKCCATPHAVMN